MNKTIVKTISFDLWETLISGNPDFKRQRLDYLQSHCKFSESEILASLKKIKTDIDSRVEKHGIQYNDLDLYKMLMHMLDIDAAESTNYMSFCQTAFIKHPPILKSHAVELLETLKNDGFRLLIASNTVFISGKTMRTVLIKLGIFDYFYDCIFSDEVGYSKPHYEFYKQLHQRSHTFVENILHTGDNSITDMMGAKNYGMQHCFVPTGYDSTEATLRLLNLLKK